MSYDGLQRGHEPQKQFKLDYKSTVRFTWKNSLITWMNNTKYTRNNKTEYKIWIQNMNTKYVYKYVVVTVKNITVNWDAQLHTNTRVCIQSITKNKAVVCQLRDNRQKRGRAFSDQWNAWNVVMWHTRTNQRGASVTSGTKRTWWLAAVPLWSIWLVVSKGGKACRVAN